jgi:NAD(P)-dependent dehydrogenase (short-subunit alcohol dehydrogenase family)
VTAEPEHTLAGKVVLVTGGAKRIGRAIALALHAQGARVALHYNTSRAEAEQTAAECGGAPLFEADLSSVSQIERLFGEVAARCGRLDGLVNNAARFEHRDPLTISEADWDRVHAVNLKAVFFCCQQAARLMLPAGGGAIVNISSLGGLKGWPNHAHYCASKAGVIMLTRTLAQAWAPTVSVNSVAPGVIPFGEPSELALKLIARTPAARAGTPGEVAASVIYFLTSGPFVTGQVLAVDGGLSQK